MTETYAEKVGSDATETAEQSETSTQLSLDERFEILKNERRRIVLEYIKDRDETVKLNELADQVTAIENDIDVESITSEERKRVYVGLYQFHLPKMAKMGVIEYDQDRGEINLTKTGKTLCREYDSERAVEVNWQRICLFTATLGIVGVITSMLVQSWLISTGILIIQTGLLLGLLLRQKRSATA